MRFAKVLLSYGTSASFTFPVDSTMETSAFVVKAIDGLQPPEVAVSIAETLYEGGVPQGRRPQNRQITLLMAFQPNYSIGETAGDLRSQLYGLMTPKLGVPVTISLLNSSNVVQVSTTGFVRRMEAPIFSKDPEVQITIDCLSPYLSGPVFTEPSPSTLAKPVVINNPGNAPSGIEIKFRIVTATTGFQIYTGSAGNQIDLLSFTSISFVANDIIQFSTIAGKRYASYVRSGVTTNLLPYKTSTSNWMQLHGGSNTILFQYSDVVITYLSYTPRYWGV